MSVEYKNAITTKRNIAATYLQLIIDMGDNFSVKDITEKLKINRGTFYLHFKSKEDVFLKINQMLVNKFKTMENDFRMCDIDKAPEVILNKINQILTGDLEFYSLIMNANDKTKFLDKIETSILNAISNNFQIMKYIFSIEHFNIVSHYIVGGVLSAYKQWFNKKIDCSLDELTSYMACLIRDGLKGCVHYGS